MAEKNEKKAVAEEASAADAAGEVSQYEDTIERLRSEYGGNLLDVREVGLHELFITVPAEEVVDFCVHLFKHGWWHLSTITGQDFGEQMQLLYHFGCDAPPCVTVVVNIPKNNPHIQSITPSIPAATLYEREVFDLFGIIFEGHPRLERLVLPDDWEDGIFPLRLEEMEKQAEREKENG